MSLFRRREREVPGLNTAALPDLIFTVLFFFMIVTHMRQNDVHVQYQVPKGTQVEKLASKSAVQYVYIGVKESGEWRVESGERIPDGQNDAATRGRANTSLSTLHSPLSTKTPSYTIQLNNDVVTLDELRQRMAQIVSQIDDADREHLIVSIRADRKTPMGVVADVKQALREASALRVHYAAEEAPLSSPGGDTNVLQQGNVSPSGDERGASSGDEKGASQ